MALINVAAREIHCKIVYYGPGLCGKTTNLKYIHSMVPQQAKGDLISIATETERTLFFDFLPLDLGRCMAFRRASTCSPCRARCSTNAPAWPC